MDGGLEQDFSRSVPSGLVNGDDPAVRQLVAPVFFREVVRRNNALVVVNGDLAHFLLDAVDDLRVFQRRVPKSNSLRS